MCPSGWGGNACNIRTCQSISLIKSTIYIYIHRLYIPISYLIFSSLLLLFYRYIWIAICPTELNQCYFHGQCVIESTAHCECNQGWIGLDCSIGVCAQECINGGVCEVNVNHPFCNCPPGWEGAACAGINMSTRSISTEVHSSSIIIVLLLRKYIIYRYWIEIQICI